MKTILFGLVKEESKHHGFSLSRMLCILGLSTSGYYAFLHHTLSNQQRQRQIVKSRILQIYHESHENYGAPKIALKLHKKGYSTSERTVGVYMKQMGIKAQWVKKSTVTTQNCNFSSELKNILDWHFDPDHPNALWCSDITYIHTQNDGFVYLTSVMDLYSRKIIAWTLTKTMETEEVLKCIEKAKKRLDSIQPLIIHTDRGAQYTSILYEKNDIRNEKELFQERGPQDNACIESFHSLLKREWLNRFKIVDFRQARDLCQEYIEGFYNPTRIHSHCGYESPNDYELMWKVKQVKEEKADREKPEDNKKD